MTKHLISLVSNQTVPNVLFINEAKDVDNYVFIYTKQVENELHQIAAAAALPTDMIALVEVQAFSLTDIMDKLAGFGFGEEDEYVLNVTGGTKMMALGAYRFFQRFKNVKVVYLGIGGNSFQVIYPEISDNITLNYQLNIREYLACRRLKMLDKKNNITKSELFTKQFLFAFMTKKLGKSGMDFIHFLRDKKWDVPFDKNRKSTKNAKIPVSKVHRNALDFLNGIGFLEKGQTTINQQERHYLIGGWLEEYAYSFVKQELGLDDDHVAHSVQVGQGHTQNEIDVFFVYKNTPYAIECKTGLRELGRFATAIYKQGAFKDKFGIDVKQVLFSLSDYFDKETGSMKDPYSDRAEQHDITVIDRRGLLNGELDKFLDDIKKG